MILIGMFDSPFVRRVAVSMDALGMPFEHRNWSVGRDFDRIRAYNPLGRVPTLVLDDGEALIESALILDRLDQQVGSARALLPPAGDARRKVQHFIALATGAVDKGIHLVIERVFKPADKQHPPWIERCRAQVRGALSALDALCAKAGDGAWLLGDSITQADITLTCFVTYLRDALPETLAQYPALRARVEACESRPLFRHRYMPFEAPVSERGLEP